MLSAWISSYLSKHIIVLLIILNLCITVTLAALLNIWIDEAFSLHTTGQSLLYAVKQAFYFEHQPPLYFSLLQIWRNINDSPLFARLFSILCIAVTIFVTSKLSKRYLEEIHPGWITAAVALNPFVIWAAVEIRMYALVMLLSALLMLLFYEGYLSETARRSTRWAYICCSLAALYTQYYLGFFLVAHACVLLSSKCWRRLGSYMLDMTIVGICFAPIVSIILGQLSTVNAYQNNPMSSVLEGIRVVYWNAVKYVLPTGDIEWLAPIKKWLTWIGWAGIFYLLVRYFRSFLRPLPVTLWINMAVLFIIFVAVSTIVGEEFLKVRHTAVMFLPVMLTVFSLAAITKKKEVLVAITLIMLFFYTFALYSAYRPMAKYGDWMRVASYIMKSEAPGEPILVFRAEFVLDFTYYYNGKNEIVPIPSYPNLESYDLNSQALRSESEVIDATSPVLSQAKRFWLITRHTDSFRGIDFHPEILETFLNKYYILLNKKEFYKSEVRLFEKKRNVSIN